jgi:hypothetical protein
MPLQCAATTAFIKKASSVSLASGRSALTRTAERLEVGNVGILVVGHVRNRDPIAVQQRTGDALDARERLDFDRPELCEVDLRPGGQREGHR